MGNLLLSLGADKTNVCNTGFMPVHAAAQNGALGMLRLLLLEHGGMDKLIASVSGRTLVHIAAAFGHADVLKFLLFEMGMDANQPSTCQRGLPPLEAWQTYPLQKACKQLYVLVAGTIVQSCEMPGSKQRKDNRLALIQTEGVRVCCPLRTDRLLVYFEVEIIQGTSVCGRGRGPKGLWSPNPSPHSPALLSPLPPLIVLIHG